MCNTCKCEFITADSVQYCLASADVRRLSFNICGVFSKQITEELCMSHGHKVLLVLDGFDEISHSFHGNSIVKDILCKQVLPACTIVLNTRPSASHVLDYFCQPQLDKHVEIVGFKEEERLKYKHEPEYQVNFLKYMFLLPHIQSMMYIPLNPAIIASMLASDNYAWVYFRREKAWYILSRDACRDLRRMTFTSGGSHFIK